MLEGSERTCSDIVTVAQCGGRWGQHEDCSWLLDLVELDRNDAKRSDVIAVGKRRGGRCQGRQQSTLLELVKLRGRDGTRSDVVTIAKSGGRRGQHGRRWSGDHTTGRRRRIGDW